MQSRTTGQTHAARGIRAWHGSWRQFPHTAFWGDLDLVPWGQAQTMHAMQKLIHIYCKWQTHDFATSCAWVSLSLSLSLLDLTTHLPLKQGKKLKTHSATLVVALPAEANFLPYKVWISILSYFHCNKVKCIEMISSHTHTHWALPSKLSASKTPLEGLAMARMKGCSSEHSRSEKIGAVVQVVACNLGSQWFALVAWCEVLGIHHLQSTNDLQCNLQFEVLQFNVPGGVLLLDAGATSGTPDTPDAPHFSGTPDIPGTPNAPGTPDTPDTVLTESPKSAALSGAAMWAATAAWLG